ncbi:MAG: acyl-CoA dehydrogenase family protein [Proteobacteria bacterium]|nr:acyl-CoA dehydrogenase family protein [Pseudomonadota bacterium]
MDFRLSDEQATLQEAARKFAASAELREAAQAIERTGEPPSPGLRRRYAELGFLGVNLAQEWGGLGLGNLEALIVLEEFAKVSSAVAFPVFESSVGPIKAIEVFGSEPLKRQVIPRVCAGELQVAVAMSEPDAGTALTDLKTRARIEGDRIVVSGQKRWCSGGGHAEGYVTYCRFGDAPGAKAIGAVYVEKDRPGVSFGPEEPLMGWRGIGTCDIHFDEVAVPMENLIGPAGTFPKLMAAFDWERCGNATMCVGLAQGALDRVLTYVQERRQFGRPICDFQAVQLKLAEMAMRVEAARLLVWRAAANADRGFPSIRDSSLAKCFANEMVREVCGAALQLMGGYGYHKDFGMEQRLRDAWGWGIGGGTIDIQKVNIASALVGRRFNQRG